MKRSDYPLEQALGMCWYASSTEGVGGRLRTTAEDFVVEEVPDLPGGEGPFLLCTLTKRNWELQRAVKEIASSLGISHKRIGWAGTKDKHAVTTQTISLYGVTPEEIASVSLGDLSLTVIGSANGGLSLGSLIENRFTVVIRDCIAEDLDQRVQEVTQVCSQGIPNYYGVQRFGVIRPITHIAGEYLIQGDYAGAVGAYVGKSSPDEDPVVAAARDEYLETRDPQLALHHLPVHLRYERAMLHHLTNHPDDYLGALQALPPKLLSMLVSAFQSYLFNMVLSARLEAELTLMDPIPGDRLHFTNGRIDIATEANLATATMHIRRGRCRIGLFVPGAEPFTPQGRMDQMMEDLLKEHQIDRVSFKQAETVVKTRFSGASRPIALTATVDAVVEENDLTLRFPLPPGHYATTVCREYMKSDPLMMI
ncbi:tRNA pseudouridine(13) synthase TruD [Methanosphaerula palustris]|uniref:Probable tRNA pseudouridine synthase D n=1 Tax=Methanosphaerula palustris (strain ATCC BAA-1556 / DSM 19958 / E1-9c) TaxID=521011 RepID=B8GDP3_METPE|nr:tRNA pseudouridine(13) synthase TruD [Methanosphaerula palustris]ACL17394.1 tRNA pseudouridine synthase D TruD [Methanosphaerula palustris E1-9c]